MTVCTERARNAPSRVAPQEVSKLLSLQKQLGTRAFLLLSCPGSPRETSRKRPMAAVRKECVTMKDNIPYKIYLSEAELPKQWYTCENLLQV